MRPAPSVGTVPSSLSARTRRPTHQNLVDSALRLVVMLARSTVTGADGVSVSLRRRGRLSTVAATDQTILDMDANQYATGEGPCVDASVEGRQFHAGSLDDEMRWPTFTPRAQALGIRTILSSPLLVGDGPVGALNIYARKPAAFGPEDRRLASFFASESSNLVTAAGLDISEDELAAIALRARAVIAQAQGVIMERDGIDAEEAFRQLRRFSVDTDIPVLVRAEHIVRSALRRRAQHDEMP
jgi:GAF domain-containing protein